ncbi:hypothetical protein E3N88_22761 [Mikania micrantha]|uniref:Reverse transcriptase Ty1/copia-type domain-containing protein n=1 Tax=Mikania micrantha TaxID=192012 RepID=A0A5N6ND31_9ASTR|nr:hypothetical protein E3N88_22761 [Mikania micrantha]
MQAELDSLNKRKVFGPIVITPKTVKHVGCKWIFVRKRNEKNEVIRYKARLVAQGFSQRPGIDYDETYSPIMDAITFRYLISLAVSKNLEMRLMDVVTAYLYGSLDSDIYMKIPEGFKIPEALGSKPKEMCSIKLQRSLYGLKQSGRMWYNRLSDYLKSKERLLKRFNMENANSLSTPMVVRSLNVDNDPFRPCENGEEVLGSEVPYLSAIGALMYLTNCTRPDISFAVNLLARFSSAPTKRHWNGIKHIFRYLRGTTDLGLFYPNDSKEELVGYADASYLSDPHKARSQTGYVFLNGGTAISWRSQKQTLLATSSNHAKLLHYMKPLENRSPTTIYEDNPACISQMKEGYIKSDRTKHIPPRFFSYTQDLIKDNQVEMRYVSSSNNSADLFTKALPTAIFRKHVHDIGMRHVQAI